MNSRRGGLALARRSMVVGSQVGSAPMPNTPPHVSQRFTRGAEIGLPRELHHCSWPGGALGACHEANEPLRGDPQIQVK
jgi:hypothetical protein